MRGKESIPLELLRPYFLRALGRRNFLDFIIQSRITRGKYLLGYHIAQIAQRLTRAVKDYQSGQSTRLIITVPFRHGKSELSSRGFPPYFLGHNPDAEVMLVCYSSSLANEMSRDCMRWMDGTEYHRLFPGVCVDTHSRAVSRWGIAGHRGKFFPMGLGGSITGKGADLLIIDDYLRSRSEAESTLMREKIWNAFTNDLLTRLAPVHLCLIVATRWHTDDLIGRILEQNRVNTAFPRFDLLEFPAKSDDYPSGYLFPERFSKEWYENQFSALGSYGASALLQCRPIAHGGNLLKVDAVQFHQGWELFPSNLRYVRFWDLASTANERLKSDPDYTVGTRAGVLEVDGKLHVFVDDVCRIRAEAPERNRVIVETARADGPGVVQGIESVAGYKDTFTTIHDLLRGVARVRKMKASGDKISRASVIEPLFEAGLVHVRVAPWNAAWIEELSAFPFGKHDDQVDALVGAYNLAREDSKMSIFSL